MDWLCEGSTAAAAAAVAAASAGGDSDLASLPSRLAMPGLGSPMRFVLGCGQVLPVWEALLSTMFKNEVATMLCRDDSRQLYVWEMQLVDFGEHV